MNQIEYNDIVKDHLINNAHVNTEFIGFTQDYYVIHCLLQEWKPKKIFEIGTNTGRGCLVMKTASPESEITTLDIMPICGDMCPVGTIKVTGDSLSYDFEKHYPVDCWFIDGHHVYENAYKETTIAIKSGAKYIIYHDADIQDVYNAIMDSFRDNDAIDKYEINQVANPPFIYSSSGKNLTRIAYAIMK